MIVGLALVHRTPDRTGIARMVRAPRALTASTATPSSNSQSGLALAAFVSDAAAMGDPRPGPVAGERQNADLRAADALLVTEMPPSRGCRAGRRCCFNFAAPDDGAIASTKCAIHRAVCAGAQQWMRTAPARGSIARPCGGELEGRRLASGASLHPGGPNRLILRAPHAGRMSARGP